MPTKSPRQFLQNYADIHLTDYKVRILDGGDATGAVTRVLLTATDGGLYLGALLLGAGALSLGSYRRRDVP